MVVGGLVGVFVIGGILNSTTESTNGHHVASNSVTAKAAERTFCANLQASETHLANGGTMGTLENDGAAMGKAARKRRG